MKNKNNKNLNSAFSLIELIVVITILLILISIIIPKLAGTSHKKEIISCAGNLKKLVAAFNMYVLENDGYAPFNPASAESGDNFWSWEALYMLGEYLGDPDHDKFKDGKWDTVRCPGNRSTFYRTGSDKDAAGNPYNASWQNRQAPKIWPNNTVVPGVVAGSSCSPGEQVVDYQYNLSLGGVFHNISNSSWFTVQGHPVNYKLDFIVKFPSETVVFCDIHFSNVLLYNGVTKYEDRFKYVYPSTANQLWGGDGASYGIVPTGVTGLAIYDYIRTNDKIHNGVGINAGFLDGHVEFLSAMEVYNYNRGKYDDLLNWGISYPITKPKEPKRYNQIPGLHGFKRGGPPLDKEAWCIEHEFKKGLKSKNNPGEPNECFLNETG